MINFISGLSRDEAVMLDLSRLYENYGYKKYKMSKFESYDLYLANKSFLQSEKIVTFTDPRGRLLALKPDITLSIIKNAPKNISGAYKVYYNENVYRAGRSSDDLDIKEIRQLGVEALGEIDLYCEAEILSLAGKSLKSISENSVIGISHMGLISSLISEAGIEGETAKKLISALSDKNISEINSLCAENSKAKETLTCLSGIYGDIKDNANTLKSLSETDESKAYADELIALGEILRGVESCADFVLDFSISNDMNYYNGIIFQGFASDVPRHVLSGGRYDALVQKMGKAENAIGFAIYPDVLEMYSEDEKTADVDVLLVYGENADIKAVCDVAEKLRFEGKSVSVLRDNANNAPTAKETIRI